MKTFHSDCLIQCMDGVHASRPEPNGGRSTHPVHRLKRAALAMWKSTVSYRKAAELGYSHVRAWRADHRLLQRHWKQLQAVFAQRWEWRNALASYNPRLCGWAQPLHSKNRCRENSSILTKRHHIRFYCARKGSTWHRHWQGW